MDTENGFELLAEPNQIDGPHLRWEVGEEVDVTVWRVRAARNRPEHPEVRDAELRGGSEDLLPALIQDGRGEWL